MPREPRSMLVTTAGRSTLSKIMGVASDSDVGPMTTMEWWAASHTSPLLSVVRW